MLIIGIHNTGIHSSAAFLVDGELIFGGAEERYSRNKYDKYFPSRVIADGLQSIGATYDDVDAFSVAWNPALNISRRYRAGFSEWPGFAGARFYSNPNAILPNISEQDFVATEQTFLRSSGKSVRIFYVNHHIAHAYGAFSASGFDDAAIFVCDGYGELATASWYQADPDNLTLLHETHWPHSIGQLYSTITSFLGFRPDLDEWKVMGASAYGESDHFYKPIRSLLNWQSPEKFELDLKYFSHFNFDSDQLFTHHLTDLLGPPRSSDALIEQRHFDIAASVQRVTEEYLFEALRWVKNTSQNNSICASGGVFMNSVFNGKLAMGDIFKNISIPFAVDDSGNSIGAAAWVSNHLGVKPVRKSLANPYLGREFSEDAIAAQLNKSKCAATKPDNFSDHVASMLASGAVIGFFQGRMEFGQRALGSRSILADPRDPKMKERVNAAVKFRESFRPFAPAILEDRVTEWFEIDRAIRVPYMEKVIPFRNEVRARVPAVVHEDGTGRLQTVSEKSNKVFYDLIAAFERQTGVPILLNTSFNLAEEPIVESPSDAIRTFHSSGLDALAIGPFIIKK